jgi:hypothetical protein
VGGRAPIGMYDRQTVYCIISNSLRIRRVYGGLGVARSPGCAREEAQTNSIRNGDSTSCDKEDGPTDPLRTTYNLLERPNLSSTACARSCHRAHHFLPALHHTGGHAHVPLLTDGPFDSLETSLVLPFTIEYLARCATTSYSPSAFFLVGWGVCLSVSSSFF